MPLEQISVPHKHIVFFDGLCNLCNSSVDYLIRRDADKKLRYGSLQGQTAARLIPQYTHDLDTFIYVRHGKILKRSSAGIQVFADLGGWRKIARVLLVIPGPIRDAVYKFVAKRRYKWYGKKETCRLPAPEERELFLD